MDTVIPNGVDPSPALDKIMSHYVRLNNMDCEIPKKILSMMLLAKAPASMETIVQMFSQILGDAEKKKVDEELIPEKVVHMMRTSWETHGRAGMSHNNQQQANKLSAVKPVGNQLPQFRYQQQQRGEFLQQQHGGWGLGGGSKRGRRGKRGRQKNAQQQLQQAMVQSEPNQQAGPSQSPPHQWVPAPTPPSYASGPANIGYFAAQMRAGRPLPPTPPTPSFSPTPPIQPTESFYLHFGAAMNLSRKLGIKPTIETVKKLEMAQQEMARKKSSDPRPTPHCQGHSTQCSQRDKCLFCGQTSPTSHCQ